MPNYNFAYVKEGPAKDRYIEYANTPALELNELYVRSDSGYKYLIKVNDDGTLKTDTIISDIITDKILPNPQEFVTSSAIMVDDKWIK